MENLSQARANKTVKIISKFSKLISRQDNFGKIVALMAEMARELVCGDRCTIWLYDNYKDEFWTKLSDGVDKEIRIRSDYGTVGEAVRSRSPIIVNDPYNHPTFNKDVDKQTGYTTKCMVTYPVFCSKNNLIAIFQVINKDISNEKEFFQSDLDLLSIAASLGGKVLLGENYQNQNEYNQKSQEMAFSKQKTAIFNQLEDDKNFHVKILYKSADVLTGDIYSLYKTNDGGVLVFIVDAMGHGIMPALTAYSIASRVRQHISEVNSLEELGKFIHEGFQNILVEDEQISCFFFWFDKDFSKVDYFGGGMYPPLLVDNKEKKYIKSNNLPFMNFSTNININTIELEDFHSLFLYTDGLVEDAEYGIDSDNVSKMLDDSFYSFLEDRILKNQMEDDTTLVLLKKLTANN